MPLYEYRCKKCNAVFEKLVLNPAWESGLECPSCKSKELEKKISNFSNGGAESGKSSSCCTPAKKFT